jgi:hypothetical protein
LKTFFKSQFFNWLTGDETLITKDWACKKGDKARQGDAPNIAIFFLPRPKTFVRSAGRNWA